MPLGERHVKANAQAQHIIVKVIMWIVERRGAFRLR